MAGVVTGVCGSIAGSGDEGAGSDGAQVGFGAAFTRRSAIAAAAAASAAAVVLWIAAVSSENE